MAIEAAKLNVIIGADTSSAQRGINMIDRAMSGFAQTAQTAFGFFAGGLMQQAVSGIGSLGREALDSYADFERLGMSLETLVAKELINTGAASSMADALDMSGEKASDLLGWIQKLTIQSPFKQQGVADAFRQAMAYGFTAEEAQRLTEATLNFAAGSGATEGSMGRIALALGQIKAKGKLAGQEMLQLTEAGLDVRGILAKAFGKSTEEIVEMQEKGLIPAEEAIDAIVKSLEEDFAGAAERQASSFSGLISSMEDIKEIGLREFFSGTFQEVQPYVEKFVNFMSDPTTLAKIHNFGVKVGDSIGDTIEFLGDLIDDVKPFADDVKNALKTGDWSGVVDTVWNWVTTAKEQASEKISEYVDNIPEVLAGIDNQKIIDGFDVFATWAWHWVEVAVNQTSDKINEIVESIPDAVENLDVSGAFSSMDAWADYAWGWIQTAGGLATEKYMEFLATMAVAVYDPAIQEQAGLIGEQIGQFIGERIFSENTGKSISDGLLVALKQAVINLFVGNKLDQISRSITEGIITGLVESTMSDLPEQYKDAIIDGLTTAVRLANPINLVSELVKLLKDAIDTAISLIPPIDLTSIFGLTSFGTKAGADNSIDGAKAFGGQVYPGMSYLVNEREQEVFVPDRPGKIVPISQMNGAGSGAIFEPGAITVYANSDTDIPYLVEEILGKLEERLG
jgi:tape measure domain-containing protein